MQNDQPDKKKRKPVDFSNPAHLLKINRDLVTIRKWPELEIGSLTNGLEYINAQDHILIILNHLIKLNLPHEEHIKQLTNFVNERKALVEAGWNRIKNIRPGGNVRKLGL